MNNGGTAFPARIYVSPDVSHYTEGMTLRDYFAAKALQAMLAMPETQISMKNEKITPKNIAGACYEWADLLLEARINQGEKA